MEKQEKNDSFIKDYSDNKSNINLKKLDGYPYYPIGKGASIFSGYAFKSKDFCDHGIPVIKIKNVNDRTVNLNDTQYIPECKLTPKTEKYILEDKDVLIAMTCQGSVGRVGQIRTNNKFLLNQRVGKFVVDEKNLNKDYLFHVISSPQYEKILFDAGHGSGQPNLSPDTIKSVEIPYPPYKEQVVIGRILSALDAKIDLNRQMNSTLEQIAQTLFKRWFIDFEFPDENGNPYKSSGGRMVDSELGEIPEGWEVKKIGDICETFGGGTPKTSEPSYWEEGDVFWATPTDMTSLKSPVIFDTSRKITEKGLQNSSAKLLPAGSILMTSRATLGYFAIAKVPISTNQGFISMICDDRVSNYYLLNAIQNKKDEIKNLASGSTFLEINKTSFRSIKIILPSKGIMQKFDDIADSIYERISQNELETKRLAEIRDSILPKLMSGKIRVQT